MFIWSDNLQDVQGNLPCNACENLKIKIYVVGRFLGR